MKNRHIVMITAALVMMLASCSQATVTVETATLAPESTPSQVTASPVKTPESSPIKTTQPEPSPELSPTPDAGNDYIIIVDKGDHALGIFELGAGGEPGALLKTFPCALGKSSRLTPTGTFYTDKKYRWKTWDDNRYGKYSPYATYYYYQKSDSYTGGLYIHGPTFTEKNWDTLFKKSYEEIGKNATSGCIRTTTEGAYWVYTYCKQHTQIKIVASSDLVSWPGLPDIDPKYPNSDPTDPDKPN